MSVQLETERLIMRRFTEADVELLVELDSDPEVMRYLTGGRATPRETVETELLPGLIAEYESTPGLGASAARARADDGFLGWFELGPHRGEVPGEVELGYRLRRADPAGIHPRRRGTDTGAMRLTEFWRRMYEHFGEAYAESFAQDHVMAELGGRTVRQALEAGWEAKDVWRVVCQTQGVSALLR